MLLLLLLLVLLLLLFLLLLLLFMLLLLVVDVVVLFKNSPYYRFLSGELKLRGLVIQTRNLKEHGNGQNKMLETPTTIGRSVNQITKVTNRTVRP